MPAIGWESLPLLASTKMGSAATTSAVLTIPPCEMLQIQFNVTGYSGGGIASFKFNADATAADYVSTYGILSSTTLTTTTTFAGFKLGQNAVAAVQRSGFVTIYNFLGTAHPITSQSITQSTTAPVVSVGGGNWTSGSSAQITSVQMIVDTGGINLLAGTSFAIFGLNP